MKIGRIRCRIIELNKSKKSQVAFCVLSMLILIGLYIPTCTWLASVRDRNNASSLNVMEDYNIVTHLEKTENTDEIFVISGWILKAGAKNKNAFIIMDETGGSDQVVFELNLYELDDVSTYFSQDNEVGDCGFRVKVDKSKLKKDACYDVQIVLKFEYYQEKNGKKTKNSMSRKVSTDYYVYNEELYIKGREDYIEPIIDNEEFKEAIRFGTIVDYDIQNECWVYEYKKKIYCIFDFEMFGTLEQRPEIPLFVYTSQNYKLPDAIKSTGREYIAHYISSDDYEMYSDSKYYLYCVCLPENLLITRIQTGIYQNQGENKGWVWMADRMNDWIYR